MSSSVTTACVSSLSPSSSELALASASASRLACAIAWILLLSSASLSRSSRAFSKSLARTATSFSLRTASISFSISLASGGSWLLKRRTREPASSIRSMALSGRYRSAMYWDDSLDAASSASSVMRSLWCSSYLGRSPYKISIDSSTDGSPTVTGWKRRSRAASFSICLRYSSRVVAPMHCRSPRASAGFRMLAASIAPSAAPAPTSV
mmetsp:Transcript_16289/g.26884  ORF Transcript_16289/g.26884 Transcript_16289/m.26884 type:complete len:208 (-) Transcript_16289:1304-1927(-)